MRLPGEMFTGRREDRKSIVPSRLPALGSFWSTERRMARDLGVRRALRRLDHLPAGVAVAVSVALGGVIGFFCLRSVGEVSLARALVFLALVVLAVPLAISARPVAVPV